MKNFSKILVAVASFYSKSLSDFEIAAWHNALKEFDADEVSRAFDSHVRCPDNGQFMPKPADIIRLMTGDSESRANVAWGIAFEALKQYGSYADVVFPDPVIHNVIESMGGWPNFCSMSDSDQPYQQTRFVKAYKSFTKQSDLIHPKVLIGIAGASNRLTFNKIEAPKPIGDREKCCLVYKTGGTRSGGNAIESGIKKVLEKLGDSHEK